MHTNTKKECDMNRTQMTSLLFSLALFGACAASNDGPAPSAPPHSCVDANPGIITIRLDYRGQKIKVPQKEQRVLEGDAIQFILFGSDDVLVSTSGKTPAAGWLNGSGKKKKSKPGSYRFFVCVPTGLFHGLPDDVTELSFGYNVDASTRAQTWPQLDPIVIIDRL